MSVPTETLREWVEDFDEHGGGADLTEDVVDAVRELLRYRQACRPEEAFGTTIQDMLALDDTELERLVTDEPRKVLTAVARALAVSMTPMPLVLRVPHDEVEEVAKRVREHVAGAFVFSDDIDVVKPALCDRCAQRVSGRPDVKGSSR